MKIHFDPYGDIELWREHTYPCGTYCEWEYNYTADWNKVTCKRCLAKKNGFSVNTKGRKS